MEQVTRFAPMPHFGELGVTVTPQGLVAVHWARTGPLGSGKPGPQGVGAGSQGDGSRSQGPVTGSQGEVAASLEDRAALWLTHLREYLEGRRRQFPLLIAWERLSPFQRAVLRATWTIPYGQVRTYGQVAAAIGRPRAARAVGRALATNPMPIVIPCHRVVDRQGRLHGYGGPGGVAAKAWLLRLEGVALPRKEVER